jgi:hypothetical protein
MTEDRRRMTGDRKMAEFELPEGCVEAMLQVYYGGYIFDVGVANLLTFVQINHPELIEIGQPTEPLPMKRQPMFAAILTAAGREYVDAL